MIQSNSNVAQTQENKTSRAASPETSFLLRLQHMNLHDSRRRKLLTVTLAISIFSVALVLNLYRLGDPSLWFDEVLSVTRARQTLPVLLQIISNTQPNMALYYVFLHFWLAFTSLFGLHPTEFVVRFPSAIFAASSSVMIFLLGRRFLGITAGILGASLYVVNDLQLVYAQQTRAYSIQLLLICISWFALFAITMSESHQKRWWICFVATATLAIYVHLFSLFILFAQVLALGGLLILPGPWRTTMRRHVRSLIVSLLSIAVLISPILIASRTGSKTGWLPIPYLSDVYHLFLTIGDNSTIYLLLITLCTLFGLLIAALVYKPWAKRMFSRLSYYKDVDDRRLQGLLPVVLPLMLWVIVPVIASYLVSQKSSHLFSSRYLVVIVPALFLLAGLGVAVIPRRKIQLVLGLCLVMIALHHVPFYYQHAQVEDWKSAAHWLQQHSQVNDGLVCYDNSQGCQVSIQYYLNAYPIDSDADFDNDSPGSFPWVDYDVTNTFGNYRAAVDPKALESYATKHARLFFIAGRVAAGDVQVKIARQWLDEHYAFIDQVVTKTVTIRLYATDTR
jgi:mannosyltransferase